MSYNQENIERLATHIVNNMDHKEIFQFAVEKFIELYEGDGKCFEKDWKAHKDELEG